MTKSAILFFTFLCLCCAGCKVEVTAQELQGKWILDEDAVKALSLSEGESKRSVLDLRADGTFSTSLMPCRFVPFGCPDDGKEGIPINGSGQWHISIGNRVTSSDKADPYSRVILIFSSEWKGSAVEAQPAKTDFKVGKDKTLYLYTWLEGEGTEPLKWVRQP